MRELIGMMGLMVTAAVVIVLLVRRFRPAPVLLVGMLAVLAFTTPRWVVMARDAAFEMQKAERLATHGLSHTLYLGLGFVENKWGIRYDDDYGEEIAGKAGIVWCSPEYFRLMWQLYLGRWAEDPVEVVRIYLEKAWMLLGTPTLYPGPPFGIVLAIALVHLLAATAFGAWQRLDFRQGLVIEGVAVAFAGLFLAQAMAALPSHSYAMPVNAFVLVLFGVIVEFFARDGVAGQTRVLDLRSAGLQARLRAFTCALDHERAGGPRSQLLGRIERRDLVPPGADRVRVLGRPAARFHAARRHAVDVVLVALVVHGPVEVLLAEAFAFAVERRAPLVLDVALLLRLLADLGAALRLVLGHLLGVLAFHGEGLGRAGRCREGHGSEEDEAPHLAPASAASIAFSASGALAASGPPPCAMSGRPPPPLPPSAATPALTSSTRSGSLTDRR